VNTEATGRTDRNAGAIEPVRTPEQFLAAVDEAMRALNAAVLARFSKSPDSELLAIEAERRAVAVTESPFQMMGDDVVAKGFTPRVV